MIKDNKKFDTYIGKIIKSKYEITEFIGKGSMGHVYKCENLKLGNTWAIKIVSKDYEYAKYFRREAEILEKINHPNIPKIVDLLEDDENIYIVETYIDGILLSDKINEKVKLKGEEVLNYFIQLAELIEYLHNIKPYPIIYRDLKPNNIIITHNNRLVLIDFSISKVHNENSVEDTIVAGNKYYSSPEQLKFDEKSDKRSDIYSLGMLALRMSTGNINGNVDMPIDNLYDIEPHMKEIIEKCTFKTSSLRYQDVSELKNDLYMLYEKQNRKRNEGKKIVLIDGTSSSGRTFITACLGKYFASNKIKTAIFDLTSELGVAEYFDINVDENVKRCLDSKVPDDLKKYSYKCGKYLEVYKGKILNENNLIELIRKVSKFNDVVLVDNNFYDPTKIYDYVDENFLVITQDEKIENLINKKVVDYVDKCVEIDNVKVIVNKFDREFESNSEILNDINIVPKIFKCNMSFKKLYEVREERRITLLKNTKDKSLTFDESYFVYDDIRKIAEEIYPKDVGYVECKDKKLLRVGDIKKGYKIVRHALFQILPSAGRVK